MTGYVLVGSQHSLYTGKLRAYLKWKGLPFEEIVASKDVYKQVILPRTGVAFIPVLVCPDSTTVLQDSHSIMWHLEQHHPQHPVLPRTPKHRAAAMLLELYGDEWLLLPAMHYRWSFPQQHTTYMHYQFGKTNAPDKSYAEQLAAGQKVSSHFSGMLPALGISQATAPLIEARFKWQLAALQQHLQQLRYLLSSCSPSIADFGFMGPMYAHLYIDPVPGCLVKCTAPLVADWIERTSGISAVRHAAGANNIVSLRPADPQRPADGPLQILRQADLSQQQHQQHKQQQASLPAMLPAAEGADASSSANSSSGTGTGTSGSMGKGSGVPPAGDVVPPTLLPLLHHMVLEQMPVILSTLRMLQQWAAQQLQQQQKQQQNAPNPHQQQQPHLRKGRRSQVKPPPGWLLLPRSLGMHSFQLFDPASGCPAAQGSRATSSYVAWRAAEVVEWYGGLGESGKEAVQQLLCDISAAGAPAAAATSAYNHQAAVGGFSARGSCSSASEPQAAVAAGSVAAAAAGSAAAAAGPVGVVGVVDAVGAFGEMVRLVGECGHLARISNRVMLKPSGHIIAAAAAAAAGRSGATSLTSKL